MDIGIFYHGTHAWVLVHPRLVDSCKNHGTILGPGVHRKSNGGLPSAQDPLLFDSVQFSSVQFSSEIRHSRVLVVPM